MICGGLISLMFSLFCILQSSCLQSVSIGWDGGVYVQTCGHTLHIDCQKSYMESLRVREGLDYLWPTCISTGIHQIFLCSVIIVPDSFSIFHPISPQNDQVLQGFSVDKGEFTCPLCRQFANSVLPCRPGRGTEAGAWHAPTNKSICVLVREVEDLQERLCLFSVSEVQLTVTKTFNI